MDTKFLNQSFFSDWKFHFGPKIFSDQNFFWQKFFWTWNFSRHKISFGPKISFRPKIILGLIIFSGPKKFPYQFSEENFFYQFFFFVSYFFCAKVCFFGPKVFWINIFLDQNFFPYKMCLDKKKFYKKFLGDFFFAQSCRPYLTLWRGGGTKNLVYRSKAFPSSTLSTEFLSQLLLARFWPILKVGSWDHIGLDNVS